MTTLVFDLLALTVEGQTVDLYHVVQHTGEYSHNFCVLVPVEIGFRGKGVAHKLGQVHRAEQAAAVRGQGLLTAGVGGADIFTEPVVIALVDLVDQDKARLRVVISGRHNGVPQLLGANSFVDATGNQSIFIGGIGLCGREVLPDNIVTVEVETALDLFAAHREGQIPGAVSANRFDELFGNQQRQVELAQATVFALGADKVKYIRVTDIEGCHLRTAAATGRGDGETHLVVDIHKGERAGSVGTGTGDIGPFGTQCREFIADTATGFKGQASFQVAFENTLHGVGNNTGHSTVNSRGGRLVGLGAGIGDNTTGRDSTVLECPYKAFFPLGAFLFGFNIGECFGNALVGCIDICIYGFLLLVFESVFFIPDVEGCVLHLDFLCFFRRFDCF